MNRQKVIFAFVLREFKTRFGTQRMGYMWMFLEPIIHIGILSIVFGFAGRVIGGGIPFPIFVMVGIIPWLLFVNIINRGMTSLGGNRSLLIYPPVEMIDPFVSRVLVEMIISTIVFTTVMFLIPIFDYFHVIDFTINFKSLPLFVLLFILYIVFAASLALIFMVLIENSPTVKKVVGLSLRPLYFLSGIFYTIKIVPIEYQWFFIYNPLSNFMEGFKSLFFKGYTTIFFDVYYLLFLTVVFLFLGLYLYTFKLKRNLI